MSQKIVVIGGGIIGCAIARELAGAGCRVTLLEKGRIGSEASSAAAGILCPQLEAEGPSALLDLGLESLGLYPDFIEAVRRETGIDAELDTGGTLVLDMTREDAASSERLCRGQREAGLPIERLSAREIANLEGGLSESVLGGVLFPRGGRVNPIALTSALSLSARARGVEMREGCPVQALKSAAEKVIGVTLAGGEILEADVVVLAAGAWSAAFSGAIRIQVMPVRGQILVLEALRRPRRHVLVTPRAYLVFRRDGTVLVGSTTELVGFQKGVTPKAMMKLIASALALDPALEEARFIGAWSGLRPGTTDSLPLIGWAGQGLMLATGHYRNGILLAPVTAALVTESIVRGRTARDLGPFSPLRAPASPDARSAG